MRVAAALPIFLVLAACAGPAPPSAEQVRASFPAGGVVDQIDIDTVERLALRAAELVGPDGHVTPAQSITANPAPAENFSQAFPTGPYSGATFGVSSIGSNALSPEMVGGAPRTRSQLLAIVSSASITLPDPVAYRRDWQKYRIRLRFGQPPGEVETREIPAPEPPPAG